MRGSFIMVETDKTLRIRLCGSHVSVRIVIESQGIITVRGFTVQML